MPNYLMAKMVRAAAQSEMPENIRTNEEVASGESRSDPKSFFFKTVDAWIPEAIQCGDPDDLRRARIVVGFTLVLLALCLEALAFFHWTLAAEGSRWIEMSMVVGLAATLLIPATMCSSHP